MSYQKLSRDQIAERVAQDIPDGAYVNLGIGLPTKISNYLPADKDVFLHSENGLLAFGPPPATGEEDPELINAGKEYVTILTGGCFFHHGDSFAMMRGGHLDIEPYRVCRRVNILRDYPDDKTKLYPRN